MIRYIEKKCIVCPRILVHFLGQVYLKSWAILFGHTVVRFMLVNNNIRHSLICYFRLICKKNIKRKIRKIIYKNIFGKIIKTIETNLYFFRGLRRVNSSDYLSNKIKHFHYVVVVVVYPIIRVGSKIHFDLDESIGKIEIWLLSIFFRSFSSFIFLFTSLYS